MFGDPAWHASRSSQQESRLRRWPAGVTRLVVVEIGAGSAIPSVRRFGHECLISLGARLIRINPREPGVPTTSDVSLTAPALRALEAIDGRMAAL